MKFIVTIMATLFVAACAHGQTATCYGLNCPGVDTLTGGSDLEEQYAQLMFDRAVAVSESLGTFDETRDMCFHRCRINRSEEAQQCRSMHIGNGRLEWAGLQTCLRATDDRYYQCLDPYGIMNCPNN